MGGRVAKAAGFEPLNEPPAAPVAHVPVISRPVALTVPLNDTAIGPLLVQRHVAVFSTTPARFGEPHVVDVVNGATPDELVALLLQRYPRSRGALVIVRRESQ